MGEKEEAWIGKGYYEGVERSDRRNGREGGSVERERGDYEGVERTDGRDGRGKDGEGGEEIGERRMIERRDGKGEKRADGGGREGRRGERTEVRVGIYETGTEGGRERVEWQED
ncbi:hypothetical protein Pmani_027669 [Petrolisthes manimaculis]|uniref:Uncharacterized protein n=1 Tax=Petrolisthes manimaculis TaxID=1843537 RepID=A0AAE1TYT5_9EUCA|nr:hypothetical protein Pmani_027669 [Petrolisthes manimaculis]